MAEIGCRSSTQHEIHCSNQ